ncbi:MAG: YlmC/YmxH family sporulation protein [Clostridia bacterium]|nr:YlmC/YmxH family sporulation protein [Clostridia bacterium]
MEISFGELRAKEVVNMSDGKKFGHIIDLSLSLAGQVLGILLPADKCVFKTIGDAKCIFVPWRQVCRIGDDVILVDLNVKALPPM